MQIYLVYKLLRYFWNWQILTHTVDCIQVQHLHAVDMLKSVTKYIHIERKIYFDKTMDTKVNVFIFVQCTIIYSICFIGTNSN